MGRVLIVIGLLVAAVGAVMAFGSRIPILGHLPGDITVQAGSTTIYIPLGSMLLISVIASIVLSLLGRR